MPGDFISLLFQPKLNLFPPGQNNGAYHFHIEFLNPPSNAPKYLYNLIVLPLHEIFKFMFIGKCFAHSFVLLKINISLCMFSIQNFANKTAKLLDMCMTNIKCRAVFTFLKVSTFFSGNSIRTL